LHRVIDLICSLSESLLAREIPGLACPDPGDAKPENFQEVITLGSVIHRLDTSSDPPKPYEPKRPPSGMAA